MTNNNLTDRAPGEVTADEELCCLITWLKYYTDKPEMAAKQLPHLLQVVASAAEQLRELREARIVPDGWLAVPAEPTGDMLARIRLSDVWTTEALTARYKDMLRAAPCAPFLTLAELQEYRKADDRFVALVAENVNARNAVQVFCDVVGANADAICEEVGEDGVKAILAAMSAMGNMPVTDAFLAEVRASAIDSLVDIKTKQLADN